MIFRQQPDHDAGADTKTDYKERQQPAEETRAYLLPTLRFEPVIPMFCNSPSVTYLFTYDVRNNAGSIRPERPLFIGSGSLSCFFCVDSNGEPAPESRLWDTIAHVVRSLWFLFL